ncbi:MAG: metal ABC transporter solute-binding protein, Zn/Mn family [Pirellulales bacterium]
MTVDPSIPRRSVRRRAAPLAWLAGLVVIAGCADGAGKSGRAEGGAGRLRVLATTTVVADLVRQVGGGRIDVDCLMAAGIDPHSYKPTPLDADRLASAGLVVASGLDLEGRLAALLERLGRTKPVVAVGDMLPADRLIPVGGGQVDPHVWFDPLLWSQAAPGVAAALATADPAGADEYRERAATYAARLGEVDAALRARVETIPAARRVLVTAHDAFRYFGRAYGIEVVGVQGTSTESEAGLGDINRLVDLVVTRRIPAVFVETSVSDRDVAALREGARARGHEVAVGGRLFSDSLGGPGSGGETLEEALAANVDAIVTGLVAGATP